MSKNFYFEREGIICTIRKHKRAKRISLSVRSKGQVTVTVPAWVSYKKGELFAKQNEKWIEEKVRETRKFNRDRLLDKGSKQEYARLKEKARALVMQKIYEFNHHYKFKFNRVSIRNQKARWGSCSQKRNLNFNYRIVHLSKKHADYLIVHELCHLRQMNHSKKFWDLVGQTIPDYQKVSKELRVL